jgi:O-antigen ligase
VALTLAFAYEAALRGPVVGLGVLLALAAFLLAVYAFAAFPHVAVAITIPLFALLPALKVLIDPRLGPVKDVVVMAAATGAIASTLLRAQTRTLQAVDRWLATSVALLLLLYVVNIGGTHNIAWAHGVRLIAEPLLLLVAGLTLDRPQRTLRYALGSLVVTACFVASIGLLQQVVGADRLAGYGYAYDLQLRSFHGQLRSFGTLDETFAYAAFLMLGLGAIVFWMRRGALATACGLLVLFGVAASFVRTAALIAVAFLALELARNRRVAAAVAVAIAVVAASLAVGIRAEGSTARTFNSPSTVLTLNGRTDAWRNAFGTPLQWFTGQGVGAIGTAAERARYVIAETSAETLRNKQAAVDSGYFATVADVGVVGLLLLLAMFGRALYLARRATRAGFAEGWVAVASIAVLMIDALTRSSFTGFPSAFLGLLILGLALAAASQRAERAAAE